MNLETVNEIIASLESAGELNIREEKFLKLAKAYVQLAAENVGLKAVFNQEEIPDEAVDALSDTVAIDSDWDESGTWSYVENETEVIRAVLDALKPETPATDAVLTELRNEAGARAVELFAKTLGSPYKFRDEKCYEDGFTRAIEVVRDTQAPRFAKRLREGAK